MKYESLDDLIRAHDAQAEHEARQRAAAAEREAAVEKYRASSYVTQADPVQYYLDNCGDERMRRLVCGGRGWDEVDRRRLIQVLMGGEGPVPPDAWGLLYAENRPPEWLCPEHAAGPVPPRWAPEGGGMIEDWGDPRTISRGTGSHVRSFKVYRLLGFRKTP